MSAAYLRGPPLLPSPGVSVGCVGKHRFESAVLAAQVAARSPHPSLVHYRCPKCGSFHVGSEVDFRGISFKKRSGLVR